MTETGKPDVAAKGRKLTESQKEQIRKAIRDRYGDQRLITPALAFRVCSMLLIILFSIGIIYNLSRRAKQDPGPARTKVIISVDTTPASTAVPPHSSAPLESPRSENNSW